MAALVLAACGEQREAEGMREFSTSRGPLQSLTLTPTDDAYVEESSPAATFNADTLDVDASPHHEAFLKFQVDVTGPVRRAVLRLHTVGDTSIGPEVYTTGTGWSESTLTWSSRPGRTSSRVAEIGAVARGIWIELDVTSAITGSGVVSFVLVPRSGNGLALHSSESGATSLRPQLVIEMEDGDTPPPPPPPPDEPTTMTFTATEDATAYEADPSLTSGSATTFGADSAPRSHGYLKFVLSGFEGAVTSARLRLWIANETSNAPAIFVADTDWTEATLNWNNKPHHAYQTLADIGAVASGGWLEVDVSSRVTQAGTVAFALIPESGNGIDVASSEWSDPSLRPQLVVTVAHDGDPEPPPPSTPIVLSSDGDASVEAANPTRNAGDAPTLLVDGSPVLESYLKFQVGDPEAAITRATLRLWVTNSTTNGPNVFQTSADWGEATVTWANRPAPQGSALANVGEVSSGQWLELDVTKAVSSGVVAFALVPDGGNGIDFASREYGDTSRRPQLVIETASADACEGLRPTDPGEPVVFQVEDRIPYVKTSCEAGTSDGNGSLSLRLWEEMDVHYFVSAEGQQLGSRFGSRDFVVPQESGFFGVDAGWGYTTERLRADGTVEWTQEGRSDGYAFVARHPAGGIVVLETPDEAYELVWIDADGRTRWRTAPAIARSEWFHTFGVDAAGNVLFLFNGAARFGEGTVAGLWLNSAGEQTAPFQVLSGLEEQPRLSLFPQVGYGLFLRREVDGIQSEWIGALLPGESTGHPAPAWLQSRPNTHLALVRGGRAYAVLPNGALDTSSACSQRVEVVTDSGQSCGARSFGTDGVSCVMRSITVGLDGTVIQTVPYEERECSSRDSCKCSWRSWPGLLR